jgi:glutamine synthetase
MAGGVFTPIGGDPMAAIPAPLAVARLTELVESGDVDTVVVAFTDVQGRLQGKRVHARYFLDHVLENGVEACDYLLAVDVDMNPVPGYAMSSWEKGYGDFILRPDLATLRPTVWSPASVMVQCDVLWPDGAPVVQSPRQVLLAQTRAAAALGFVALVGTEPEFMVFDDSYQAAWASGYRKLTSSGGHSGSYSVQGGARVEPLVRELRHAMSAAGLVVESAEGGRSFGQQEISFKHAEAVTTADQHVVYKLAAREIAAQHHQALTFMAKVDERAGNSCHLHMNLRGLDDGAPAFAARPGGPVGGPLAEGGRSPVFGWFVAGVLATLREFTLLYAPNINSYKRFQPETFAPTVVAWGEDNRTCALRVLGRGASLRVENRVPGGDVNPYLAIAAMLAGGLFGIRSQQPLEPALIGNAYAATRPRVPATLREARTLFDESSIARAAFGDAMVDHYVTAADVELDAFERVVTDWELFRGFERL